MTAKNSVPEPIATDERTKKFNEGILVSVIVHLLIVAVFIIQVTFFSQPVFDLSQAVRVDMVTLPDKLAAHEMPQKIQDILNEKPINEKAKETLAEKTEEKVVEKTPEKKILPQKQLKPDLEAINLKKIKAQQKSAVDKLKKMSAIDRLRQEEKNEPVIKKPVVVKGRIISAGSTLTGLDKLQSDNYLLNLDGHIKQYWSLPQWLINKSFRTRILVKFDANGNVLFKQIVQPSGEPAYDSYCMQAIDQATPFPKFIEKFSEKYSRDGVVIGFPE